MAGKITKTEAEWRAELSDLAYEVTRKGGTERAGTGEDFPKSEGLFHCTCCGAALFPSDTKYESGSGWPSFFHPLPGAVEKRADNKLFMQRTEVVCAKCDAHLGHVFSDGPKPTGQRYCLNGVALKFEAK